MADLVTREGQIIQVPDEQASALVASGQLGLPQGAPVNLLDSEGRVVSASDPTAAIKLIQGGSHQLAPAAAIAADRERQQYEGQIAQTALEGAARGATLGLSDVALDKLAPSYAQEAQKRETYNPEAALAGEAGGALGAALLTGGGSAGAEAAVGGAGLLGRGALGAARLATAPARLAMQAGERAAAVATRIAEGHVGKGALGRAAAAGLDLGTAGAVEGALTGAAQTAARDYVTDHEVTAERIAVGAGLGGLLGGAAGGVLGATGSLAASTAKGGWESLSKAWGKNADEVTSAVAPAARRVPTAEEIVATPKLAQESKPLVAADLLQSADEESVASMRRAITAEDTLEKTTQGATRSIGDDLDEFLKANDVVDNTAGAAAKKEWLRSGQAGIETADPAPYLQVVREIQDSAQALKKRLGRSILDEGGGGATLRRIQLNADETLKSVDTALKEGRMGDVFDALDEHKRFLGRAQKSRNREVAQFARNEFERARGVLEDEALYGNFARVQKPVNATWHEAINREADADVAGFLKRSGTDSLDPFERIEKANRESLGSFLDSLGDERYRGKEEAFRRWLRAKTAAAEVRATTFGDAASKAAASRVRGAAERIEDKLNAVALAKGDNTKWKQTRQAIESLPLVGGLFRGARAAVDATRTLKRSAVGAATRGQQSAESASRGFLAALTKPARATKRAARQTFDAAVVLGVERNSRDRDKRVAERAHELADPQSGARAAIRANLAPARIEDPARAAALEAQVQRTGDFLSQKASEVFRAPANNDLWGRVREAKVPQADRDRFARYAHAAENPRSILDSIAKGEVTREEVETLRALYPRLYQQVVSDVLQGVATAPKLPPYAKRVQLAILLGAPTDPSLQPQSIAAYQQLAAQAAAAPKPGAQGGAPLSAATRHPPKIAQQYATLSDRALSP